MAFNADSIYWRQSVCLQTQAQTDVKLLTYALTTLPTNKYNISYMCYDWQSRIRFLQLDTELKDVKHVYSKRFAAQLSTRALGQTLERAQESLV